MSLDEQGTVYQQWFRRDNGGRVEILKLGDGKILTDFVRGTETGWQSDESMSFSSVSIRDGNVYRCRPEQDFGLCLHAGGKTTSWAITRRSPLLSWQGDHAIVSGLDGRVSFVPLTDQATPWSFQTPVSKSRHGTGRSGERTSLLWGRRWVSVRLESRWSSHSADQVTLS